MKIFQIKSLLPLCLLAFASSLFGSHSQAKIVEKNMAFSDSHLVIMEDNSMWLVYPVTKRTRTLKEWWNKVSIEQPDVNFLFSLNDWKVGTALYVKEHFWTDENQSELSKYNNPKIANCTHILENPYNQQLAFARPISMTEAVGMFMEHAKAQFKVGEEKGKKQGFQTGFESGRTLGNQEGSDRGYQKGLEVGVERGHTEGVQDGYQKGYKEGYDAGYQEGYSLAKKDQAENF